MKYHMKLLTPEQENQKEMILKRIGSNMKRLRLSKGYSMEFMAREMFTNYRTYYGWEAGEKGYNMPVYALVLARMTLGVKIEEFFKLSPSSNEKAEVEEIKEEGQSV